MRTEGRADAASTPVPVDPKGDVQVTVVDTDVHPSPRRQEELIDYLPKRAQRLPASAFNGNNTPLYVPPNNAKRHDSYPPGGGPPCSDPDFTERQLLEAAGIDYAILLPLTARATANPEHEAMMCSATNEWLSDTWLGRYNWHGRYRGGLRVSSCDAKLAADEIRKWAGDDRWVEVMLLPNTQAPLGQRQFWPIYEAAARSGLPVALHVNRAPGIRLATPVGFSSYFIEHHSTYPLLYATHLVSMIFEGVFEQFPSLNAVLVEGGFSWVVPLMWRLDNYWRELRSELPHVPRKPSDYIRERVRFTSQPIEEPASARALHSMLEWGYADELLMFSSDYPHWDFDDPKWLLRRLPTGQRAQIFAKTALAFYGLPSTRQQMTKAS